MGLNFALIYRLTAHTRMADTTLHDLRVTVQALQH
jgi:hypothetical protein